MMNVFAPASWSTENRIIALIAYFDIFDLAVSREFIKKNIFGNQDNLDLILDKLTARGDVLQNCEQLYFLKGRRKVFDLYSNKKRLSEEYLRKSRRWSCLFRYVPFVQMVAVCNYLSYEVADEESDIDLLILTRPGRIFIAKVFLTVFTHLLGLRRHGKKIKGRFCLSFYVNSAFLEFEQVLLDQKDIYMAFWLPGIYPIYGSDKYLNQIFEKNEQWLKYYFDDPLSRKMVTGTLPKGKNWIAQCWQHVLGGKTGDLVEDRLAKFFKRRFKKTFPKLPAEASIEISEKRLKFHNQDKRDYFRKMWMERLKRLGIF